MLGLRWALLPLFGSALLNRVPWGRHSRHYGLRRLQGLRDGQGRRHWRRGSGLVVFASGDAEVEVVDPHEARADARAARKVERQATLARYLDEELARGNDASTPSAAPAPAEMMMHEQPTASEVRKVEKVEAFAQWLQKVDWGARASAAAAGDGGIARRSPAPAASRCRRLVAVSSVSPAASASVSAVARWKRPIPNALTTARLAAIPVVVALFDAPVRTR